VGIDLLNAPTSGAVWLAGATHEGLAGRQLLRHAGEQPQAGRSRGRPHGAANAQVLIIRNFAGEAPGDNTEKMDAQITLWETG
jgi:hypothetical protein